MDIATNRKKRGNQAATSTCFPLKNNVGPALGTQIGIYTRLFWVRYPVAPPNNINIIQLKENCNE